MKKTQDELNEKLSVAELRLYEGNKEGKDLYTPLSKVFIARDENTAFDVIKNKEEYPVYQMHDGVFYPACKMANSNLELGDIFCVVEKDLDMKTDIVQYMIDSPDFFYQRLPYLQERFDLCSDSQNAFYLLPTLKKYQRKIKKDRQELLTFKMFIQNRREKLIEKAQKGNSYKIKTNQF